MSSTIPVGLFEFEVLLEQHGVNAELSLRGSPDGLAVFLKHGDRTWQLHTQRGAPRVFRSPATAVNFFAGLGVDRLVLESLSNWDAESYVNQSSRRRRKSDDEKLAAGAENKH